MTLSFVLTEDLKPVPKQIQILQNFGHEMVFTKNDSIAAEGDVILISSDATIIRDWLSGKDIWIGNGLMGYRKERVK